VPLFGGLLGGVSVGLVESLYIVLSSYGTQDYSGIVYAVLLYGAAGAGLGAGLGLVAAVLAALAGQEPEPARSWTFSYLVVACGLALVIGRFLLRRDFFAETGLPARAQAALLLGLLAFALPFWFLVKNALAKTWFSFVVRPLGSAAVYALVLLVTLALAVAMMLDNRAAAEVAPRPVAPPLLSRPNILLVVVDTLRPDALGVYSGPAGNSPQFDRLANQSLLWEDAVAPSSWTRPSFASLLTSSVPCTHKTTRKADVLPDALDTLAETLQRHGYTTGALVNNINVTASFNFHQGFDTFEFLRPAYPFRASEASFRLTLYAGLRMAWERWIDEEKRVDRYYRDGREVTDRALEWLGVHGQERWFLLVHYMEPHDPYFPHPYDGSGYARVEHPHPAAEEAADLRRLYDGEVRYWDEQFGRLLAVMEERGLLDSTVLAVTADHGEEFMEHGGYWHGTRLYDESVRVPLLLRPADAKDGEGRRIKDPVRLIDLAPTLAELAGAAAPPAWQGFSLLREYALREPKDRLALLQVDFEGNVSDGVRDREWKLIRNERVGPAERVGRPREELFFLPEDRGEMKDLARNSQAAWALAARRAELDALMSAGCGAAVSGATQTTLSAADCEALRALGYVSDGRCGAQ
jgi:arylsulfatase A-like enzyme